MTARVVRDSVFIPTCRGTRHTTPGGAESDSSVTRTILPRIARPPTVSPMQISQTDTPFSFGAQKLSTRTLRRLIAALPALYAETRLENLPAVFTTTLTELVPGESHGVVVHNRAAGQRHWHLRPATSDHVSLVPGFFANFHEFAPADYRRTTGSGAALALSDFISRPHLQKLHIFRDYYQPLGLEDDLSVNVRAGETVICAAVLRQRRGFGTAERELMNALRPHFKQAWINATLISTSRAPITMPSPAPAIAASARRPEALEVRFGLTPREAEVLLWVAEGKTNPEIALILGNRPSTVRTHLEHVFAKLGVETRHAAALCALGVLGLLEQPPQPTALASA
jgi:DNA-binding CsgD family transcriptional regulator